MDPGVDAAGEAPGAAPLDGQRRLVELPRPFFESERDALGAAAGVEERGQELDGPFRALDVGSRVQGQPGPLGKGGDDAAGAGDGLTRFLFFVFFPEKGGRGQGGVGVSTAINALSRSIEK